MNKLDKDIIEKLAYRVAELGGRAYMVGGAVRGEIMKRPIKDVDIEVHGISEEVLESQFDSALLLVCTRLLVII